MGNNYYFYCLLRQGFSETLEPVLELALVDQAGLKLIEMGNNYFKVCYFCVCCGFFVVVFCLFVL